MAQKVIRIPTLNDGPHDFARLFGIWSETNDYFEDIRFDFSHCNFLRPNAVAFLGGLARLIQSRWKTVTFDRSTLHHSAVMANLCQNGFAGTFAYPSSGWDGNSIPYREDKALDMNGIMDYLTYNWIGKGWVHVSDRLRDAIAGRMWEIYSNAFEHSGTEIGVFSCGQHYRRQNNLILSAVDFGRGIPANVRFFLRQHVEDALVSKLSGAACLKWAFERGNSTCTGGVARGLGLDLLKEFVRLNQGKLEIYSNDGYAIVDKDGERYENRDFAFEGTVMHITLRCDENLYRFRDEAE
ncbi:ATP-binding protein [Candidatus Thiosymbion oneisti]|uniref:ATP-binding protein n=1 Tax=Candidatus Thiosymbion oneisti TaxID=589554 RepID=UPI000AF1ADAD|nr:ATP-binding protein [Candidatus Thiosymbion oneisti]